MSEAEVGEDVKAAIAKLFGGEQLSGDEEKLLEDHKDAINITVTKDD
jgi:hypothetical protein